MKRFVITTTVVAAIAAMSSTAAAQDVRVTLTEFKLALSRDTVTAGSVTFRITNQGSMDHALMVMGTGVDKSTNNVAKGEVSSLTVVLKPGTVEVSCPLAEGSHKTAGMHKTLVVVAASAPAKKTP